MKEFKIDNKGSGRLFQNNILESLTRTNFYIPVVFYFFIGVMGIVYSMNNYSLPLMNYILLIPAGIIFFTLIEYFIHRFIFHFHATTTNQEALQYHIHGIHHEFPRDKDRLVMPPVISVFLALAFFFFFKTLFNENGLLLFSGFVSGYSIYLIIHYAVHAKKPPQNFLKIFWKHHALHHYDSAHSAVSVSFPFWDYLFGTMPSH